MFSDIVVAAIYHATDQVQTACLCWIERFDESVAGECNSSVSPAQPVCR